MAIISVSWRRRVDSALQRDLVGVGQRAEGVAHAISEARDEAGVQPVGLGAFAFGDAEGLDAARIDEADGKAGRRQGLDEGVGVGPIASSTTRSTPSRLRRASRAGKASGRLAVRKTVPDGRPTSR